MLAPRGAKSGCLDTGGGRERLELPWRGRSVRSSVQHLLGTSDGRLRGGGCGAGDRRRRRRPLWRVERDNGHGAGAVEGHRVRGRKFVPNYPNARLVLQGRDGERIVDPRPPIVFVVVPRSRRHDRRIVVVPRTRRHDRRIRVVAVHPRRHDQRIRIVVPRARRHDRRARILVVPRARLADFARARRMTRRADAVHRADVFRRSRGPRRMTSRALVRRRGRQDGEVFWFMIRYRSRRRRSGTLMDGEIDDSVPRPSLVKCGICQL